eukprot:c54376_g1_i1 orf=33-323(+)
MCSHPILIRLVRSRATPFLLLSSSNNPPCQFVFWHVSQILLTIWHVNQILLFHSNSFNCPFNNFHRMLCQQRNYEAQNIYGVYKSHKPVKSPASNE